MIVKKQLNSSTQNTRFLEHALNGKHDCLSLIS